MKTCLFGLAVVASLFLSGPVTAQPAPPLTSVRVEAVASSLSSAWDYVQGAPATSRNHGGPILVVATREIGYGQNRIATFNGVRLSEDRPAQPIRNGNTVVGWYRYWRYTGNFTSGTFRYQTTSINYPFNTLSAQVLVR